MSTYSEPGVDHAGLQRLHRRRDQRNRLAMCSGIFSGVTTTTDEDGDTADAGRSLWKQMMCWHAERMS